MSLALVLKTGDTFPSIVARLEDLDGQIGLSSVEKVEIYLSLTTGSHVVEGKCVVTETEEEINGKMTKVWLTTYTFTTEDTAQAGVYDVEHKITWSPGVIESVPNSGYDQIEIQKSL